MKLPAREVLTVYWDGEEVAGFIVFALGGQSMTPRVHPDFGWTIEPEIRPSTLAGERWRVAVWYVRVVSWPAQHVFEESVGRVLRCLVAEGYPVAWIGIDGSFVDPPDLFLPAAMPRSVLAACSADTGLLNALDLDQPLRALADPEMRELREASGGFAAAE